MKELRILLISVFLLWGLTAAAQTNIAVKTYQLPVLADQEINVVKRFQINSTASSTSSNGELVLQVDERAYEVIEEIGLWYTAGDSTLIKQNNISKYTRTKKIKAQRGKNKISFQTELEKGANFLWLTIKVRSVKDLELPFAIRLDKFEIAKRKIGNSTKGESSVHRMAVAVRRHKQENVHTSRIPGIITAKDGSLISVYDARYESGRDLQGHMDIGVSRSIDRGATWLPIEVAIDMGEYGGLPQKFNGVSDPNILLDEKTGDIYVAGLWMYGVIDETGTWYPGIKDGKEIWNHQWKTKGSQPGFGIKQTSQFLLVKSQDNGKTWSSPINLTTMCKKQEWWLWAPAPGHGLTLKDGTLVMPTQGRDKTGKAFSNITYSKDRGKTWTTSNAAVSRSTTECMAVELEDGRIMLNMRSNLNTTNKGADNGRAIATTADLGKTWIEHPTSHRALIEPTCMASIHKHQYTENGAPKSIIIFCNPDSKYERVDIALKVSKDNADTWERKVLLDEGKSRGYSCITSIDDHTVGVLYESSQADLVFQRIALKDLL
ncbi:sialidase [Sphingobacterium alkalisoli]|uniref:exo-alpha-sialidase n=1 Tax=Sphingobacterium alkalisoli TaxID=1874115 RepID=A0A4U0H2C2_9SPHI|nr:sialidase family protein [Sphingobacterium alkalisoli]TJY65755.1 sialidase [Sphingobacterium alkalisoli]GGH18526.1 sialidase [Sphingobacterium alkalisoli]